MMAASKKTLNAANLEELGAKRLAELLIELTKGDAAAKRKLRLELAGNLSPSEAAKEVRKRLDTIRRSNSFVDWHKTREFVSDLDVQLNAITSKVAPKAPKEAFELLKKFLSLAENIYERVDDSSGYVGGIFEQALESMAEVAQKADLDPIKTAEFVLSCVQSNEYGEYDDIIPLLAPAMGADGLKHLKQSARKLVKDKVTKPADKQQIVIDYSSGGAGYEIEWQSDFRKRQLRSALQEIADAQGDVDGFIEHYSADTQTVPAIAAEIAERLLAADRIEEAWAAISKADLADSRVIPHEWGHAKLKVLEAKGEMDEAQAFRWSCFEGSLNADHLKTYLKRLPDFDDLEAEERALSHATTYVDPHHALSFLVDWGNIGFLEKLVLDRADEFDGNHWHVLPDAAEALEEKAPLAATILYRKMIDYNLVHGKYTRYKHSGKHLAKCDSLSTLIDDYQGLLSHDDYVADLRKTYPRRESFWQHVG